MEGARDQIDHQEQQDGTEPPRMVHIEEAEEIQYLIKPNAITLNIIRARGILCNYCADDGEDGKENEERDSEFERTEKVKKDGEDPTFLHRRHPL